MVRAMKANRFPQWRGFEQVPSGCLLDQVVELEDSLGFAYERSSDYYKDYHRHSRLMIVLPRGACVMEVRTRSPKKLYRVDGNSALIVPANLEHDDESVSALYDTLALYPDEKLLGKVFEREKISALTAAELRETLQVVKRSPQLNCAIESFFAETRMPIAERDEEAISFYYRRVLREVFREAATKRSTRSASVFEATQAKFTAETLVERALQVIEVNLFTPMKISEIGSACGASSSTLLRVFRKELQASPSDYIRRRRLEESRRLLQSGERTVSEIAVRVGYESAGAFSEAYKQHFGYSPSKDLSTATTA
jgi:AraC-like DNA-binding protein